MTYCEELMNTKPRLLSQDDPLPDAPPLPAVELTEEPSITASGSLAKYAADHVKPTIEALLTLEATVKACRETLEQDLRKLTDHSRSFADHNVAATNCLNICTEALEKLVNGRHEPS